jgi:Thioredoxin like C-terminal domain
MTEQRLYQLIRQPGTIDDRQFEIEFLDSGVGAFVFTFAVPPGSAEVVAADPSRPVKEESAAVPSAASAPAATIAQTQTASDHPSTARAEVMKPVSGAKHKAAQMPLPAVRPVMLAQRFWGCWSYWCGRPVPLMLGVAY